jgi:hypothetical protein
MKTLMENLMEVHGAQSLFCMFEIEIENDYGRFRIQLPFEQAITRIHKIGNGVFSSESLSDFYHCATCECGWSPNNF